MNLFKINLPENKKERLRFLFINPSTKMSKTAYVPLGIAYLAAILESNNIFVRCIDYQVEKINFDKLRQVLKITK